MVLSSYGGVRRVVGTYSIYTRLKLGNEYIQVIFQSVNLHFLARYMQHLFPGPALLTLRNFLDNFNDRPASVLETMHHTGN